MITQEENTQTTAFTIQLKGPLESSWLDWFDDLSIFIQDSESALVGILSDQSGLNRILNKIYTDGLSIISVSKVSEDKRHNHE